MLDNQPLWVKSSRSTSNGNCVEAARTAAGIAIRDSKDPDGPALLVSHDAWRAFVEDVRTGSLDGPSRA